jgi:opacity protein-like surface antigen
MMKKLALTSAFVFLGVSAALSADLKTPVKAKAVAPPPAPVIGVSPFYIGMFGGVGMSPTVNDFTLDGQASGGIKGYPTGILAGVHAGYSFTSGPVYWGATLEVAYDFSRGCVDIACMAARKNGFLLQEGLELGISMTTLGGYIPSQGQPSNWPVPITLPASVWSNMIFAVRGGMAERNLDLCAFAPDGGFVGGQFTGSTQCGSKFIAAPYVGGKLKFMASTNSEIAAVYDHVFWGNQYQFTPAAAVPLFSNSVNIKSEDIFKLQYAYHL